LEGLLRQTPEISPRWLYDDSGSDLFERITHTEEYYLTRKELELLEEKADDMSYFPDEAENPDNMTRRVLVELGAGSGRKTQLLLEAFKRLSPDKEVVYAPIDVSSSALEANASNYNLEEAGITLHPFVSTYQECLPDVSRMEGRKTFLFLGSSLGNYSDSECVSLMKLVRDNMGLRDRFLIGVDTPHGSHKSAGVIEAAYNDKEGITAEFTLNGLKHVNKEAGTDFDPDKFRHIARYDEDKKSVLTWVESLEDQHVTIKGNPILKLKKEDKIFMEQSRKFSKEMMENVGAQAGLMLTRAWTTEDECHLMCEFVMDAITEQGEISSWIFDELVEKGIGGKGLLEKPIELRHPFIFYKGHIPAFSHAKSLPEGYKIPGYCCKSGEERAKDLSVIFERGMDPEVDEPSKIHRHSPEPDTWPTVKETNTYDQGVRSALKSYVQKSGYGRSVILGVEHEAMHQETLMYMAANSDVLTNQRVRDNIPRHPRPMVSPAELSGHAKGVRSGMVEVKGAPEVVIGATNAKEREIGFVWDNETPSMVTAVESFSVSRLPVTNAEFLQFVKDGGYLRPELWGDYKDFMESKDLIPYPVSWVPMPRNPNHTCNSFEDLDMDSWSVRTLIDGPQDMSVAADWPAVVSLAEATAYCNWLGDGSRIMTEEEYALIFHNEHEVDASSYGKCAANGNNSWKYAGVVPVGSMHDATEVYGISDLVGNGWEWTSSEFKPLPGFKPMEEYPEYSTDFFGEKHQVMKGASPFTDTYNIRLSLRNWFQARYRYMWAKFRIAKDL